MKKPYTEGLATHGDPESCTDSGDAEGEALTGASAGWASSREIPVSGAPTPSRYAEGHAAASENASSSPAPRGLRPQACAESPCARTGRPAEHPSGDGSSGRDGKGGRPKPSMNAQRESDSLVVPTKPSNKASSTAAEVVEGRRLAKGNVDQQNAPRTQRRISANSALDRVRQAARRDKEAKFTALLHHVTLEALEAAFWELKKKAAPGVDGVTWEQYGTELAKNVRALHDRLHRGAYRAKPSRRAYIPKADGKMRPLGIAALEDKLVQRVVVGVLNAIYEEDFMGFSYGSRPGRSQHNALDALATAIERKKVNWVLDADIRGYFDTINHEWLMKFVAHRIADKRVLRLIQKWLSAGVMEEGRWTASEEGTPQGATVSPLLANLYLHYVFDLWFQQWRKRTARGEVIVTRWADDFIVGFQHWDDAELFQRELRKRLAKFSLELHPEKTRLIEFGKYARERRAARGEPRPASFNFLGFTHICGETRKGEFQLRRQTINKRMAAKLREVKTELRFRRHLRVEEQGDWLSSVVRGFFAYHAVPTNSRALQTFRREASRHWQRELQRRSQRTRMTWGRYRQLEARWLPPPRIQHPWPNQRFDVTTQSKSRVR
jgi:RNA-directed DNA polymerase